MFTIALIAGIIYVFTATQKNKQVALKRGIEDDQLTLFAVLFWFYALPPLATFLFVQTYDYLIALTFIALYIPGIVLSRKLSVKLSKGYDYERRAGREYDKAMWLGFLGIGLVIFNWFMLGIQSAIQTR